MKDSNLTLKFDKSNESFLTTFLGIVSVQIGFEIVLAYLENINRTKNILQVWVNAKRSTSEDISKRVVKMAYQNQPIDIKNISQLLTTCQKCVDEVLRSTRTVDLIKVAALLKECGYQVDVSKELTSKDVNAKKSAVIALTTSVVTVLSLASGVGTVAGATCATLAIGLWGTRAVDTVEAATPRLYGEVGIRTPNDILIECRKWLAIYDKLDKISRTKYELPKLEYKLLKKIMYTVGETLRYTGMALRSYSSYI